MRWGLATLSFNRYKVAHNLLGRSCILCFETVLKMNKITFTPTATPKNKKISKFFFIILMIFEKNLRGWGLLHYLLISTIWRKVCWGEFV